jgi:transcriptional regulator with XRE-family HTH domain
LEVNGHTPFLFQPRERRIMLGNALKLVRMFHSVKQNQFCKEIGVAPSYISAIESGKKEATLDIVNKYANYFNMPVSSLMLFSENLQSDSLSEKLRMRFADKMLKIMEWVVSKDDHEGANEKKEI